MRIVVKVCPFPLDCLCNILTIFSFFREVFGRCGQKESLAGPRSSPNLTFAGQNTEDEILKAAVSKYGKNQWARISSLVRPGCPPESFNLKLNAGGRAGPGLLSLLRTVDPQDA